MIGIHELTRGFGEFSLAIDRLEIDQGCYGVILGPSGSGKTLLLKVICGLYRPDSGRVSIAGADVTDLPVERRKIGMVFQEPSLFPHYSVHDNIAFGLKVAGSSRQAMSEAVNKLSETLRLADVLKRPVRSLSGGEIQKVALARALAVRPEVLLLDEPLSQVDHHARQELQVELQRIHRELELTILHVTHNREEAFALAESCAVMLGGRILQHCDATQMREQPVCPFVARFLGLKPREEPVRPPGCSEVCLLGTGMCDRDGSKHGQ